MENYHIFKEFNLNTGHEYTYMCKGRGIRIDLFRGFKLWQVPELLKRPNWRVIGHYTEPWKTTYYVHVM